MSLIKTHDTFPGDMYVISNKRRIGNIKLYGEPPVWENYSDGDAAYAFLNYEKNIIDAYTIHVVILSVIFNDDNHNHPVFVYMNGEIGWCFIDTIRNLYAINNENSLFLKAFV